VKKNPNIQIPFDKLRATPNSKRPNSKRPNSKYSNSKFQKGKFQIIKFQIPKGRSREWAVVSQKKSYRTHIHVLMYLIIPLF
jgi:hypothetical protein